MTRKKTKRNKTKIQIFYHNDAERQQRYQSREHRETEERLTTIGGVAVVNAIVNIKDETRWQFVIKTQCYRTSCYKKTLKNNNKL